MYFELKNPIATNDLDKMDKLAEYLEGVDKVYFKTYQHLKQYPAGGEAWDYVEGYADTDVDLDAETGYGFDTECKYTVNRRVYSILHPGIFQSQNC